LDFGISRRKKINGKKLRGLKGVENGYIKVKKGERNSIGGSIE
jgi:hypothetical protein